MGKVFPITPPDIKTRPGVATTFGILNCIWGGLGLIGTLDFVAGLCRSPRAIPTVGRRLQNVDDFFRRTWFFRIDLAPTGIGLLNLKSWGRTGTIFYAVYSLVMSCVSILVVFMTASEISRAPAAVQGGFVGGFIGALLFSVLYSILLLVFMNSPKMRESYG